MMNLCYTFILTQTRFTTFCLYLLKWRFIFFSLEEQHKNELMIYKTDSQKMKELTNDETNKLKQLLGNHRIRCTGRMDVDIQKLISEKDEKINEMTTRLRQIKVILYSNYSNGNV